MTGNSDTAFDNTHQNETTPTKKTGPNGLKPTNRAKANGGRTGTNGAGRPVEATPSVGNGHDVGHSQRDSLASLREAARKRRGAA